MAHRSVRPRTAALANLLFPGSGYLLLEWRVLLGGLLVGYTMITAALAVLYLSTLYAHFPHVGVDGLPGIVGTIILYAFQHASVAIGTSLDAHQEARARELAAAAAAPAPGQAPAVKA